MGYKLITAPIAEPLTKQDVYLQAHIDSNIEDSILDIYIQGARELAEHRTNRKFMLQTWELAIDEFPSNEIKLPFAPVFSIVSIKYIATNGTEQTINPANYTIDNYSLSNFVLLAQNYQWPDTLAVANAVKVRFEVGYPNAASVPSAIKQWMLLVISTWYKNRETAIDYNMQELPRDFVHGLLDPLWIPSY